MNKEKVVIPLNGVQVPFLVSEKDEPYFRQAKDILNDRFATLTSDYAAKASSKELLVVLAVDALVDALKINERYQLLKEEVSVRLNDIQNNFSD